jgi:hypothetical protein
LYNHLKKKFILYDKLNSDFMEKTMSGDAVENVDSIRKELAERANEDKLYRSYRGLFD